MGFKERTHILLEFASLSMESSHACVDWYVDTMTHLRNGELEKLVPPPCNNAAFPCCPCCLYGIYSRFSPIYELLFRMDWTEATVQAVRRLHHRPMTDEDWMWIVVYHRKMSDTFFPQLLRIIHPYTSIPTSLLHLYADNLSRIDYLLGPEIRMNIDLPQSDGSTALLSVLMTFFWSNGMLHTHHTFQTIYAHVQFFLERGADPILANKCGISPLSYIESLTQCPAEEKEALLALLRRYA